MAPAPLLLLPGIEGDGRIFQALGDLWGTRLLLPRDLPDGDDVDAMAGALLDAAPPRLAIFGASLGGLVGWAASRLAPDRVVALVTLGSLPHPRHRPRGLGLAAALLRRAPPPLVARRYRARIRARHLAEGVPPERSWPLLANLPPPALLARRLAAVAAWDPTGPPPVPTLWLRGQVDDEAPWTTAEAAADLPGVAVETVPGGHRAMLTHPGPLAAVVGHFLRGLDHG